jgi:phosphatidate cytidylyltransferase
VPAAACRHRGLQPLLYIIPHRQKCLCHPKQVLLITRLWTGGLLILVGLGILWFDAWLAPWYPVLLVVGLVASVMAARELCGLFPGTPRCWLITLGVALVVLANWPAHLLEVGQAWHWIGLTAIGLLLTTFLIEARAFLGPGETTQRIALTWLAIGYLGVLASFLFQLRWLEGGRGEFALALAIFVPKSCDIGAYFTGRAIGRHHMSPILSPKKTWEGAAGGLIFSTAIALGINALGSYATLGRPLLSWPSAAAFGLVVGLAGMLGDLMESMLKRDSGKKDTANLIPSFGGVLDVLDAILFSAPVSYVWLVVGGWW